MAQGQTIELSGAVTDSVSAPIEGVNVILNNGAAGTTTDAKGFFSFNLVEGSYTIEFRHLQFDTKTEEIDLSDNASLKIKLKHAIRVLGQVEVSEETESSREQVSVTRIDPKSAKELPSAFGEFTKILNTLPGVASNNELSSSYSVRGGNFDENLVYVNDMPIYRPFLVSGGQQEGLSFVNSDLVEKIEFSSGGWQAKYGDKLSSSLNIQYKNPERFAGSATVGLLGGAIHLENVSKNNRVHYLVGARHKSAQYLLNTLETEGEYLPRFTDFQSYVGIDLGKEADPTKTELGILTSYARNRYLVQPEGRETTFGTFNQQLRLFVAFDGQEILSYDTFQGGLKLSHRFSERFKSSLISSAFVTREREFKDVEGGYRLCDVNNNPGSQNFNECVSTLGIGTNYGFTRNILYAEVFNVENRSTFIINDKNTLEFGFGYANESIEDELKEFDFVDSADFVTIERTFSNEIDLKSKRYTAYVQNSVELGTSQTLTLGTRVHYWDVNDEFLFSPRLQYSLKPNWQRDVVIKAAVGVYHQPPFYRELRDREGQINRDVKAQRSLHVIAGLDYDFKLWNRDFKFLSEAYYKSITNVNPYDVDNVKIRYFAENIAKAYAAGVDFRISGEFIPGSESWFSLGVLTTKEDLENDDKGYIRRPSDQRVNLGIFFQDHMPNDPTLRMHLNLLFGTGLPFSPPKRDEFRNAFSGQTYRRVDIGFSKSIIFNTPTTGDKYFFESLWIGAEVLNLLGAENIISYFWVNDFNNRQFAVPNGLSARFLNVKLIARF